MLSGLDGVQRDSVASDFVDLFDWFYWAIRCQFHYKVVLYRLTTNGLLVGQVYQTHVQINGMYERLGLSEDPSLSADWRNNWDGDRKKQEDWLEIQLDRLSANVLLRQLRRANQLQMFILWENQLLHDDEIASGSTVTLAVSDQMAEMIRTTQKRMEWACREFQPGACCAWFIRSEEVRREKEVEEIQISCMTLCRGTWFNPRACTMSDVTIVRLDIDRALKIDDAEFPEQMGALLGLHDPHIIRVYVANHISSPTFFVCEPVDGCTPQDFF